MEPFGELKKVRNPFGKKIKMKLKRIITKQTRQVLIKKGVLCPKNVPHLQKTYPGSRK